MEILHISDLSFSYPETDTSALQDVSFSVSAGEFVVICGESGCGKTTLLKLLKPALAPAGERSGILEYCGSDLYGLDERRTASEIGYVLQNPDNQIVTDRVWHELAFGLESLGLPTPVIRRRVGEMASYFGIQDWFRRRTDELSGGQKQLLNLASVMVMQPRVLILDEPTAGLDPAGRDKILSHIKSYHERTRNTILIVSHSMEDIATFADRILVMNKSELFCFDETKKVFARADEIAAIGLDVPQITKVFGALRSRGLDFGKEVYTVGYARELVLRELRERGGL